MMFGHVVIAMGGVAIPTYIGWRYHAFAAQQVPYCFEEWAEYPPILDQHVRHHCSYPFTVDGAGGKSRT